MRAGRTKSWNDFKVPQEAVSCGFHEAARGVLSHHMVIQGGKIANYQPYPPTPWNASVRDVYGTPGPYEDAVQNTPIFEENGPENFKGVDIMRAVRSFDPCLPCGVHMYTGGGRCARCSTRRPACADAADAWTPADERRARRPAGPHGASPEELIERVERLTAELERLADPSRAARAEELVAAVIELYGQGLERIFAAIADERRRRAAWASGSPATASSRA